MANELQALRDEMRKLSAQFETLQSAHTTLQSQHEALQASHQQLQSENALLRRQNAFLRKQLFGKKSERLDRNQLELALGVEEAAHVIETDEAEAEDGASGPRRRRGRRGERKVRIPEGTPTEERVIDPEEVKANPQAFKCIGEEVSRQLDVVANPYVLRITRRRKFKSKKDRKRPPLVAPVPPRPIEGSLAGPSLLADIVLKKYVEHLPLYRQEQILRQRYRIGLSRKTMCDWVGIVAGWLKPIYHLLGARA